MRLLLYVLRASDSPRVRATAEEATSRGGGGAYLDAPEGRTSRQPSLGGLPPAGAGGAGAGAGAAPACASLDARPTRTPPLPELLAHLQGLWRDVDGTGGARLDQQIVSRLLKSLSVSAEVSEACRHTTLSLVETLAVCYADELVPNNELAISSLLVHALAVMSHLSRARRADAAHAASAAVAFLQRNGSALAERLVDLFKEAAEMAPAGETRQRAAGAAKGDGAGAHNPPKGPHRRALSRGGSLGKGDASALKSGGATSERADGKPSARELAEEAMGFAVSALANRTAPLVWCTPAHRHTGTPAHRHTALTWSVSRLSVLRSASSRALRSHSRRQTMSHSRCAYSPNGSAPRRCRSLRRTR